VIGSLQIKLSLDLFSDSHQMLSIGILTQCFIHRTGTRSFRTS